MSESINRNNYTDATLDQWANDFWTICSEKERERNLLQTWSMVVEYAASVGEAIREEKFQDALVSLARAFFWIGVFSNKLNKDSNVARHFRDSNFLSLGAMVWFKYPKICPACLKKECLCPVLERKFSQQEAEEELSQIRGEPQTWQNTMPGKLDAWEDMFREIYHGPYKTKPIEEIGFHFLEEIGEVQCAIRHLATLQDNGGTLNRLKRELFKEIADTVSWTFSLVKKIEWYARNLETLLKGLGAEGRSQFSLELSEKIKLSQILWNVLRQKEGNEIGCPECGKRPCDCKRVRWKLNA